MTELTCDNTAKLMYQYADSQQLLGFFRAILAENCVLLDTLTALETRLDIDTSVGIQLDLIGEIVGVPRPLNIQIDPDEAFGFDELAVDDPGFPTGVPPDYGWSGVSRADRGGRFVGVNGLLVGRMYDSDYRTLIRARIFANQATGTIDDVIAFLAYVLGVPNNTLTISVGSIEVNAGRPFSSVEEDIIMALIPLAAGISLTAINQP